MKRILLAILAALSVVGASPTGRDAEFDRITHCIERNDAVRAFLKNYHRPITILDIGAVDYAYDSVAIQSDDEIDATLVMLDHNDTWRGNRADALLELCQSHNNLDDTILLTKKVTTRDFNLLSQCEHFDTVFAFDLIDRYRNRWRSYTEAILELGDNILIQVGNPGQDTSMDPRYEELKQLIINRGGTELFVPLAPVQPDGSVPGTVWWVSTNRTELKIPCWRHYKTADRFKGRFRIASDWGHKVLYKKLDKNAKDQWARGINAYNFIMLNGVYPSPESLSSKMDRYRGLHHNDFKVWNLVIQGKGMQVLDFNDRRLGRFRPKLHKKRIKIAKKIFDQQNSWPKDTDERIKLIEKLYSTQRKIWNLRHVVWS